MTIRGKKCLTILDLVQYSFFVVFILKPHTLMLQNYSLNLDNFYSSDGQPDTSVGTQAVLDGNRLSLMFIHMHMVFRGILFLESEVSFRFCGW